MTWFLFPLAHLSTVAYALINPFAAKSSRPFCVAT
jgi:hypothetical protein